MLYTLHTLSFLILPQCCEVSISHLVLQMRTLARYQVSGTDMSLSYLLNGLQLLSDGLRAGTQEGPNLYCQRGEVMPFQRVHRKNTEE